MDDIAHWHWVYYHFDQVDDGPRFIAEVLWSQVIVLVAAYVWCVCG
jgi:hypothetical protein